MRDIRSLTIYLNWEYSIIELSAIKVDKDSDGYLH